MRGIMMGLPVFLTDVTDVLREAVNGAATTAGVFVPGDNVLATSTTGDVRGTWAPASVPNSALVFEITAALRSVSYRGRAQAIA